MVDDEDEGIRVYGKNGEAWCFWHKETDSLAIVVDPISDDSPPAEAMESAKTVETSQVVKGSPELAKARQGQRCYEITATPQALELCKEGGQIMGIDDGGYHTLSWNGDSGHFEIRFYQGRPPAAPEAKSFEQLIADVGNWEPPQEQRDPPPIPSPAAVDVAEARALRPWRLPTLEECANDPEATRVWNAVHKPALEWHRVDDGGPPISGEGDSRSDSEHRTVWIAYPTGDVEAVKAFQLNDKIRNHLPGGRLPTHWMEADTPKPPSVPMSNAELHNEFE